MSKYANRVEFMQALTRAHMLIAENGDTYGIVDNDDTTPYVIKTCTDILVQWYRRSGVEYTEMPECITTDVRTALEDMLYAQEQEMRAQESQQ